MVDQKNGRRHMASSAKEGGGTRVLVGSNSSVRCVSNRALAGVEGLRLCLLLMHPQANVLSVRKRL
jgi:hypothetical protein